MDHHKESTFSFENVGSFFYCSILRMLLRSCARITKSKSYDSHFFAIRARSHITFKGNIMHKVRITFRLRNKSFKKTSFIKRQKRFVVLPTGLEPAHLAAMDPKSIVSANSTTGAFSGIYYHDSALLSRKAFCIGLHKIDLIIYSVIPYFFSFQY